MRIIAALLIALLPFAAQAQEHLAIYGGQFDILQGEEPSAQFGAEYRGEDVWYGIRPTVGGNVNTDGGLYGYAGINWDVPLSESFYFTPNFVVGAWAGNDSKDLGHALEFRSGIELGYQFPAKNRLGVAFNHISNASIGDDNPGSEALLLVYSHPVSVFGE